MNDYSDLKRSLNLEAVVPWLLRDARDDFFPDPIGHRELRDHATAFLETRRHRIFQTDTISPWKGCVPKKGGLRREGIYLHPCHRLLYLAILHRFLPRLDSAIRPEIYSYRIDSHDSTDAYPFDNTIGRWKDFHNDFRRAALDSSAGAVLLADIASFYDHISCDQLCKRIHGILDRGMDNEDRAALRLLSKLLNMWGHDGHGIPQNHDPSSFFGSLYLHPIDQAMVDRRYRYFRWVDDIRVVAVNTKQATRALHDLQDILAKHRLFLASNKVEIVEKGTPRFNDLLSVGDEVLISQIEEAVASRLVDRIEAMVEEIFKRLEYHAERSGDDRKFRAYMNRLLDASDYEKLREPIAGRLHKFVDPRVATYPERTNDWIKALAVAPSEVTLGVLRKHLIDDASIYEWQRCHLWRLATSLSPPLPEDLHKKALDISRSNLSEAVAAHAIVCAGRHGTNTDREIIYADCFSAQRSYLVQRAVLIAIQEIPPELRTTYYQRAITTNSDHAELVTYLEALDAPYYGEISRPTRNEAARTVTTTVQRGVGLVDGQEVRFRLSRSDYSYD